MPLNPTYLPGVIGLDTESPENDRDPRSLLDTTDSIISRSGFLESRHAHRLIDTFSLSTDTAKTVYVTPYEGQFNFLFVTNSSLDNSFKLQYRTQATNTLTTRPTSSFTLPNSLAETDKNSPVSQPVIVTNQDRIYVMINNGIHYLPADLLTFFPQNIQETFPSFTSFKGSLTTLGDVSTRYIPPGFAVDVIAVIEEDTELGNKNTQTVNLASSPIRTFSRTAAVAGNTSANFLIPNVDMVIRAPALSDPNIKQFVQIYRTEVYETIISSDGVSFTRGAAPTTFYPAVPRIKLNTVSTSISKILDINDDGIIQFAPYYASPSVDGNQNRNIPPPIAKSLVNYKNYFVYSHIRPHLVKKLALTALPVNGSTLQLRLIENDGTTATTTNVSFTDNIAATTNVYIERNQTPQEAVTLSSSLGQDILYTARSTNTTASQVIQNTPLAIVAGSAYETTKVSPYLQVFEALFDCRLKSDVDPRNIAVTLQSNLNDTSRIPPKGFFALCPDSGTDIGGKTYERDSIQWVFSYNSFLVSTQGLTFSGCLSYGRKLPKIDDPNAPAPPATPGDNFISAAYDLTRVGLGINSDAPHVDHYLYILDGSTLENIPLYPTDPNLPGGTLSPVLGQGTVNLPVAQATSLTASSALVYNSALQAPKMRTNALFLGPNNRGFATLLDDTVKNLVDEINRIGAGNLFAEKLEGIGEFFVYSFNPRADKILMATSSVFTEPPQATTLSAPLVESELKTNALVVSRKNQPQSVTLAQNLSPTIIGDSGAIVGAATTTNDLFIFKETGIYRLEIFDGPSLPQISASVLFDSTTFCQAQGSIQEMNEVIYFLSQKGFISLSSGSIVNLTRGKIETEVKRTLSKCLNANLTSGVRSFANEAKRLYACYIPTAGTSVNPTAGVTYVYDAYTDNWTKWSLPLGPSFVQNDGKLLSVSKYGNTTSQYFIRQDFFTEDNPQNPIDQVELALPVVTVLSANPLQSTITGTSSALTQNLVNLDLLRLVTVNKIPGFAKDSLGNWVKVNLQKVGADVGIFFEYGVTFPSGGLIATDVAIGVNTTATFNSFKGASPTALKQFSEYQLFTENSSAWIDKSFKSDTKTTYSNPSNWTYSRENTTIYRTLLPLEASRGRLLYVEIGHSRPYENFAIIGQTIVYRDMRSFRNQRDV